MTNLNPQQKIAVNSNAKRIVCLASAGSGKTFVLLQRINRIIADGAAADSILALTFTNAAAHEMLDRYKREHPNTNYTPVFSTFHAFCYSIIIHDTMVRSILGYSGIPSIATDEDIRRIAVKVKLICGTKLSDKKLAGKRTALSTKEQFEYDVYWKQYKKQFALENLITFDMMCDEVANLFIRNHGCVQQYKEKYKYIFADEHQDTNSTQMDFLSSFTEANLYVCGDPQQMLYRFRGCTNDIIKELAESSDWELIKLPHNYRSTRQIVEYSNRIFADAWKDSEYYLAGESDVEGGRVIVRGKFPTSGPALSRMAAQLIEDCADKTVAVICRTNSEVDDLRTIFSDMKVPIRGKSNKDTIIHILRSALDSKYCVNWLSSQLPIEEYMAYTRMCVLRPEIQEEDKFIPIFGTKFVKIIGMIFDVRKALSQPSMLSALMTTCETIKFRLGADTLANCVNIQEGVQKIIECLEQTTDTGVYIGTIHSVKGLEYDIVHVIGVNSRSFPVYKDEDNMACYYVACTRAKTQLTIWCDDEVKYYDAPVGIFDGTL